MLDAGSFRALDCYTAFGVKSSTMRAKSKLVSVLLRLDPGVYRRLMVRAAAQGLTPMRYIRAKILEEDQAVRTTAS